MLNLFFRKTTKKVKSNLPNPNLEHRLIFRKGAINTIKQAKGWRTDADMARALGLTRAYVSMLHKTRTGVTSTVLTRLATQMGNITNNWWIYYEIVPWGITDKNHPQWNEDKYKGRIPYMQYSTSAEFRRTDYQAESLDRRQ